MRQEKENAEPGRPNKKQTNKQTNDTFQARIWLVRPICCHVSDEHESKLTPLPGSMPPCLWLD